MSISGKIVLVTGAASGIGSSIANLFNAHGAYVQAADLNFSCNTDYNQLVMDVSNPKSVEESIDKIMSEHGRLDAVINSAGIGIECPFIETSFEIFERILRVNLCGTFLVNQFSARAMIGGKGGSIVNIASVSGLIGNMGRSAYGTSKGGVISLSKILAAELACYNIRVNTIAPGPIETALSLLHHSAQTRSEWLNRVPLKRYGTAEEVAKSALFLCSDDSSYITGDVIAVDGGFMAKGIG